MAHDADADHLGRRVARCASSRIELFSNVNVLVPDTVPVLFLLKGNEHLEEKKLNALSLAGAGAQARAYRSMPRWHRNEYQDLINVIGFDPVFVGRHAWKMPWRTSVDTNVYGVEAAMGRHRLAALAREWQLASHGESTARPSCPCSW